MTEELSGFPAAIQTWVQNFFEFIPSLIAALVIFILGLIAAAIAGRVVERGLKRRKADPEIVTLLTKIARWTVVILGTTIALQQVNFNLTAFLTGLGIVGFTIGFALQDVSKNFVAGILLLIQQPFEIGDAIEVSDFVGTVLEISLRATEIRTLDGRHVFIPNGDIFTSPITNFTRAASRRAEVIVGVDYASDLERVRQTAIEAISGVKGLLQDPPPEVVYQNFGGTTIDFTLYFWVDNRETNPPAAQNEAIAAIKVAFDQAGIEMPFPTQTIQFKRLEELPAG